MNFDFSLVGFILLISVFCFSCIKDEEDEIGEQDMISSFTLSGGDGGNLEQGQYNGVEALIRS